LNITLEPIPIRSLSLINENKLNESTKEQLPALKIENGEVAHLKPSQLPLMNQVNITLNLFKSIFIFRLNLYIYVNHYII